MNTAHQAGYSTNGLVMSLITEKCYSLSEGLTAGSSKI